VIQKRSVKIEINGKEYEASELTLKDFEMLKEYPITKKVESFMRSSRNANLPPSVISETITKLYGELDNQAEQEKYFGSASGMRLFVWLSLRHKHPQLQLDDIDFPLSDLERVSTAITAISSVETEDEKDDKPKLPGETSERPT